MSPATGSEATAAAPATVANLGPGFDVLGLALSGAEDTVTARLVPGGGVRITRVTGDGGRLPQGAARNTAGIAAAATLRAAGVAAGVDLELRKGLPLGSGLGSSAASAAAAALAVNTALGSPLRKIELVGPALEAEEAVSGRHADNVAPALLGGLLFVRSVDPLEILRLPVPEGLTVVVATPGLEVETRRARAVLPPDIPFAEALRRSSHLATFIAACYTGDMALFARCLEDEMVNRARAPLIPGCGDVMRAAREAGALGSSISGAGPSIFAFCHSAAVAPRIAAAMTAAFAAAGLPATTLISPADCPGARVL